VIWKCLLFLFAHRQKLGGHLAAFRLPFDSVLDTNPFTPFCLFFGYFLELFYVENPWMVFRLLCAGLSTISLLLSGRFPAAFFYVFGNVTLQFGYSFTAVSLSTDSMKYQKFRSPFRLPNLKESHDL